jgi:hypothetical protein
LDRASDIINLVLYVAVTAGLIARRRWRLSWSLDAYVGLALVVIPLIVWWPEQFFWQWFFLLFNTIANVLKIGIATETTWRTFRLFPRARSTALVAIVAILAITAIAATTGPLNADVWTWQIVVGHLFPRLKAGTIWLMAVPLVLALWYRVPIHRFHAEVLVSWVVYLGLTSAVLQIQAAAMGAAANGLNRGLIDKLALVPDFLLPCYWAYMAWRPDDAMVVAHDETLRRLDTAAAGSAS